MTKPPQGPGGSSPGSEHRRDEGLAVKERRKVQRPARFKVVLYNDDYTPMEFVIVLLEQVFAKGPTEATQLMLEIHRSGQGIAGVYVIEVAEMKVAAVHRKSEERGHPLRAGVEPE